MKPWFLLAVALGLIGTAAYFTFHKSTPDDGRLTVRIGHFPNVTHAQALVAHHLSRQGKGWFEERLGPDVKVEWYVYNAGPSATEAIFANSIDLTYVGPGPAISAYARAHGEEIRIVAGAADAGAALVIHHDSPIRDAEGFRDKKIATPQLGNTQDIAARAWLKEGGLKITQLGGDAQVVPTANPDQLALFASRRVEGVWTVEPWVARLEREARGKILVEEKDAVTTVLVTGVDFTKKHPDVLAKVIAAHKALTDWIRANPQEAQKMVVAEMEEITHSSIDPALIATAWPRIVFTNELNKESLQTYVNHAHEAGFLTTAPALDKLIFTPPSLLP